MTRFIIRRSVASVFVVLVVILISLWITRLAPSNPCLEERDVDICPCVQNHHLDRPVFPVYTPLEDEHPMKQCPGSWEAERRLAVFPMSVDVPIPGAGDGEEDEASGIDETSVTVGPIYILGPGQWTETQAATYVGNLARGSLGDSMVTDWTVGETLRSALPYTIQLALQSLFFALLFGIPAGLIAGLRQNSPTDYSVMTVAMIGVSIPNFVLGPLLILLFSLHLGWFSATGWYSWQDSILPSITLGLFYTAYVARLTRGGVLEVIRKDYIRTARAKGLSERVVVMRHALKGALLPVVSYLGPAFAAMLAGSVVVEEIFGLPGVGTHFIRSALNRDYNLVLGTIILYSSLLVFLNLVVDILYTVIDPRVDYEDG